VKTGKQGDAAGFPLPLPSARPHPIQADEGGRKAALSADGRQPNGVDFLAGVGAGRAKLLLSRIAAASAAPIPAAP